jgi:lysozyme
VAIERSPSAAGRRNATWLAAATAAGTIVLASPELMDFLGRWEGAAEHRVYADKLAGGLPTVCKGLTKHVTDTPIVVGQWWGPEKCEREERAAVERVQLQLAPCFTIQPPQAVLNMGTSHAWNNGAPATCGSGAMRLWNVGDWEGGCRRLSRGEDGQMVWSFTSHIDPATGKKVFTFVRGLANRRAAETGKCLEGV